MFLVAAWMAAPLAGAIGITAGPYLQNVAQDEATLMWVTDADAVSWVEIAPCDSLHFYATQRPRFYESDLGRAVVRKKHRVRVTGLQPGTVYRYRVFSREVKAQESHHVDYGRTVATDVFRHEPPEFRTPSDGDTSCRFMVVNDIHEDSLLLADLLRPMAVEKPEFLVLNGDMVNYMDSEQQMLSTFVARVGEMFASETPFYMVRGNHESRGAHAMNYMDYFATPTGKPYYTFRRGGVYFVVLDGGEDKPDNDIEYSGTSFCDAYRAEQAMWLKEVTASDEFRNSPFRVVLLHVPPVQDTWHGPLHEKELWLPILNEAGIDLMLCAHLHKAVYNESGTDGAVFPVLINSNREALAVEADGKRLTVRTLDRSGKVLSTRSYDARKPQ